MGSISADRQLRRLSRRMGGNSHGADTFHLVLGHHRFRTPGDIDFDFRLDMGAVPDSGFLRLAGHGCVFSRRGAGREGIMELIILILLFIWLGFWPVMGWIAGLSVLGLIVSGFSPGEEFKAPLDLERERAMARELERDRIDADTKRRLREMGLNSN